MNPFEIIINGQIAQLGMPLPANIHHLSVLVLFPIQLPSSDSARVKQWLNSIVDRLTCSYVSYNNVLIPIEDLVRFS